MKWYNYLFVVALSILSGCVGNSGSSSEPPKPKSPNIVVATFNGAIYQNGTILPGDFAIKPNNFPNTIVYQGDFIESGNFITCGNGGVKAAYPSSWSIIGNSFSNVMGCVISTNQYVSNDIYFAYSDVNGMIRAYVYKNNWRKFGTGLIPFTGAVVGVANDSLGNMYVGVNNQESNISNIYISNGSAWHQAVTTPLAGDSYIVNMSVNSQNQLFVATAGTQNGVFKITTSGAWESVGNVLPDSEQINAMVIDSNDNIVIGTLTGNLYQLQNNIWQQITSPQTNEVTALAVDKDNNLYLSNNFGEVYKNINNSWVELGGGRTPDRSIIFTLSVSKTGVVAVGDKDGNVYTLNADNQWVPLVVGAVNENPLLTTFVNESGTIFTAGAESSNKYSYVYYWNGSSWGIVNNSYLPESGLAIRMMATNSSNNLYVADLSGSVYTSKSGAWSLVNDKSLPTLGLVTFMLINQGNDQIFVAQNNDSGAMVYESVNGTWSVVNNSPVATDIKAIGPLAIDNESNLYVASGGLLSAIDESSSAVFESLNGAWHKISPDFPTNQQIISMNFDKNNHLFVGTINNFMVKGYFDFIPFNIMDSGAVYESVNGTWKMVNGPLLTYSGGVSSIKFDTYNNMYISTLQGDVYESQNGRWQLKYNYNTLSSSMAIY